ncbi:phosphate-selective porin [Flammeovirgaceae bacterium 311]|nr:phosphate-selective porin [Flammeovirgaceae bacterium 311]
MRKLLLAFAFLGICSSVSAQQENIQTPPAEPPKAVKKPWYESFNIRGYAQVRYNGLFETNPRLGCEQCDKSWGDGGSFFIRRIRIIFSGQISERVYFYIQPDFASAPSSNALNFAQIRDAYLDVGLDKKNEFRFRIGQSKVPFGFENLQSSQNRIPLDRADPTNSAVANERDLGVFFYWAPTEKRKLLSALVRDGLKGSGDYGIFGLGIYNGQTANRPDENGEPHVVARLTYPFAIGNQIIEPSIQGYTGKYVITSASAGTELQTDREYIDRRVAATFVLYPKPFGIQAEYNIGEGPEFNTFTDAIEVQELHGGYTTLSYMKQVGDQIIIPFARMQYYKGGKKHELDARSYRVRDLELGVEWQPFPALELVAMYTFSSRRFEDFAQQENLQEGSLMRFQAQLNF